MKVYIAAADPLKGSLKNALLNTLRLGSVCDNVDEATLVIVEDKRQLQKLYDKNKFFLVARFEEVTNLPENARWFPLSSFLTDVARYINEIDAKTGKREDASSPSLPSVRNGWEYPPSTKPANALHVLIVDDNPENLKLALVELLNDQYYVTLASGYTEALQLIRSNRYDAVLTDCQMSPETEKSALSLEAITIGETVHNGIFLVFHATRRGARVALVTDANHHQDWVSALLDDSDLREPQTVNGQPVLLINYRGKRWDEALQALMAL